MFPFKVYNVSMMHKDLVNHVVKECRRREESWYEFDLEVFSRKTAVVHVYGMLCSFSGGRGGRKFTFGIADEPIIREFVLAKIREEAAYRYHSQLEKAQEEAIARIADEIKKELGYE